MKHNPFAPPTGAEARELAAQRGLPGANQLLNLADYLESDSSMVYGAVTAAQLRMLADVIDNLDEDRHALIDRLATLITTIGPLRETIDILRATNADLLADIEQLSILGDQQDEHPVIFAFFNTGGGGSALSPEEALEYALLLDELTSLNRNDPSQS